MADTPGGILSQYRWPEAPRRAKCRKMDLVVLVRDERPDAIAEFPRPGDDHESDGAIHFPGRVPALHEVFDALTHALPDALARTPDHLRGEHRIDFERGEDGLRAHFRSASSPWASRSHANTIDSSHRTFVEDVGSKHVPCGAIRDARRPSAPPRRGRHTISWNC